MKLMRFALWLVLCMAFLGFAGSFGLESSYESRAEEVQIVRIDQTQHSRFGPVTIDVGEPVVIVLDDQAAVMKNKTATGLPMLDADAAARNGGAILRLDSVRSIVGLARLGCVLSAIVAAVGLVMMDRVRGILFPPEQ